MEYQDLKHLIFEKLLLSETMIRLFQMFDDHEIKLDPKKRIFNQKNLMANGIYKRILEDAGLLDEYYEYVKHSHTAPFI